MKILLYTPVFYPMVGGMETVAECMADLLVKAGHECIVLTPIETDKHEDFSFKVYRNVSLSQKISLIRWADIVYSNGATLALLPLTKLIGKPYVWKHAGYQASCIDGLGWVEGKPAPMSPWKSIGYHLRHTGIVYTAIGGFKLWVRRFAARYIVSMNVAITQWVAKKQPFKRQIVIHNPSPLYRFTNPSQDIKIKYDFVYLGRLVSEKGVETLLKAFRIITGEKKDREYSLLIIGDGNKMDQFQLLAEELGIKDQVCFAGSKRGQELTDLIHSSRIAIVPSEWEEPMGIVALELMAADRNIIVSEKGGLQECVGDAGLVFNNGDENGLVQCMKRFIDDQALCYQKRQIGREQLKKFNPQLLVGQYIQMFESILKNE